MCYSAQLSFWGSWLRAVIFELLTWAIQNYHCKALLLLILLIQKPWVLLKSAVSTAAEA